MHSLQFFKIVQVFILIANCHYEPRSLKPFCALSRKDMHRAIETARKHAHESPEAQRRLVEMENKEPGLTAYFDEQEQAQKRFLDGIRTARRRLFL